MYKRIFTIVIDSLGIGALPDSPRFGDLDVNTLGHISEHVDSFKIPNLQKLGLRWYDDHRGKKQGIENRKIEIDSPK